MGYLPAEEIGKEMNVRGLKAPSMALRGLWRRKNTLSADNLHSVAEAVMRQEDASSPISNTCVREKRNERSRTRRGRKQPGLHRSPILPTLTGLP